MSDPNPPPEDPDAAIEDEGAPAEPRARSQEEVARALGAAPAGAAPSGVDDEALREGGRLRLDKSGALAGRPKLEPVKAHRKRGAVDDEAAGAKGAPGTPGAPRKASLPPRLSSLRPEGFETPAPPEAGETVETIDIPAGPFLYGEGRKPTELGAFTIDKFPVTNADYQSFVEAVGHRPPLYWEGAASPENLRDHPVVGIDYFDALAFARWKGKDLPFEDEWERAARGTDGRVYPWGNDQELSGANTARVGLNMTVPVDLHTTNVSPDGCRDMVGNVWEMTHSPAPGGGVVVRGGSWYDFALYAKTFFRFASRPDARNGTIGFRCLRRENERSDADREVAPEQTDAEIAARRGAQPPADRAAWSQERRDLLVDVRRLRAYVAEARAEELLAPKRGVAVTLHDAAPSAPTVAPPAAPPPPPPPTPVPAAIVPPVPPPEPEEREAPVEALPEPERLHVESAPAAPRVAAAPPTPEVPETPSITRVRPPRALPAYMKVLLVAGFLLLVGLIAVFVNRDDDEPVPRAVSPTDRPPPAPSRRLAALPEPAPAAAFPDFDKPPRVLDMAAAGGASALRTGTWLLLFADTETSEGQQTLRAAQAMHRRLATHGVHVAVVLPRAPLADADGWLPAADVLAARLRSTSAERLWHGIHVLLDPFGPDGRTRLSAEYVRADEPVAAVLLEGGRRWSRTSVSQGGFNEESLARIAQHALDMVQ